jgi:hypothetical protein
MLADNPDELAIYMILTDYIIENYQKNEKL